MRKSISRYRQVNHRIMKMMLFLGIVVALVVANVLFTMTSGIHFRSGRDIMLEKSGTGKYSEEIIANRGHIYDRNKEVIAQDIEAFDLYANIDENRINATNTPAYVTDFNHAAEVLAPILECEAESLVKIMENAKKAGQKEIEFGEYGKRLSAEQKKQIEETDLTGLGFRDSTDRVYPVGENGNFASQMIGYAQYNYDEERITGVSGIEAAFDEELKGENGLVQYEVASDGNYLPDTKKYTKAAQSGNDVYLTLDKNVQLTLEKALSDTMESNKANKAWGVVMEADTGKVLAQAGYPSYNLNERDEIKQHYNIPSELPFECGSVIKPFIVAGAIESGIYNGSATFDSGTVYMGVNSDGSIYRGNEDNYAIRVSDAQGKDYGMITYDEGIIRSTNTVIMNLFLNGYSPRTSLEYLKKFGFFNEVDIYGLNENKGILNDASPVDLITLGFGQGSTVNAYQLVQAASALFTDGRMVKPYVVDKIVNPNTGDLIYEGKSEKSDQIVSENTAKYLQGLMKKVISEDYGTGHVYQMSDVSLMAKTGTGEIYVDGGYSRDIYTTSILAAAPAEDPEVIVYYAFESSNFLYYNPAYFQDLVREALLAIDGYSSSNTQNNNQATTSEFNVFKMPQLVNHSLAYANEKLNASTSNIVVIGDGSSIISQYPAPNEKTISSQKVFLMSDGANITMPNMSGWSRKDVMMFAKLTGLNIDIEGSGNVKEQSISEKTVLNKQSELKVRLE